MKRSFSKELKKLKAFFIKNQKYILIKSFCLSLHCISKATTTFLMALLICSDLFSQTITIDGIPADWPSVLSSGSIQLRGFTHDEGNVVTDNIFSPGPKDIDPVSGWGWTTGFTNKVRNIENAGAAVIGNNIYFFSDRLDVTDAGLTHTFIGAWFFLNNISPTTGNSFTGSHSVGDILVLFDIAPELTPPQLFIYEWVGSGGSNGSLNFLGTSNNSAVNATQQPVPPFAFWSYSGLAGPFFYGTGTFFEGAIDISNQVNRCFRSFLIETRTSISLTATLVDFASGEFDDDGDNDGFNACVDCDNNDPAIYPGATEICDGKDNNCNGQTDEGFILQTFYADGDGDGYGNPNRSAQACSAPEGYVSIGGDCNDLDPTIHPGAIEVCDRIDNNCDGQVDEGLAVVNGYKDLDNDGYGNPATIRQGCLLPAYITTGGDCNDNNASINPGVTEICGNSIDDNCDGQVDEGCGGDPTITINDVTVSESQGEAQLTVSLSQTSSKPIKINYTTVDGTAVSKGKGKNPLIDFIAAKGTLTIPAGALSAVINISIISDGIAEPTENFSVQLSIMKGTPATISKGTGIVTILDGSGSALTRSTKMEVIPKEVNQFSIKVLANPSHDEFLLRIESNSMEPTEVRVFDLQGTMVKLMRSGLSNLRFGSDLKPGVYIVEVRQQSTTKVMKLIKL